MTRSQTTSPAGSCRLRLSPTPALTDHLTDQARLAQQPGSGFHYSNPGFDLLELLVQDITGTDFADHMERAVLGPLGMHSSGFSWTDDTAQRLASGHDARGEVVDPYVYASKASGGLLATIDDLARFVAAGMPDHTGSGSHVLSADSLRTMYSPTVDMAGIYQAVSDAHGLGYFLETLPDGHQAVFYGGQGNGWLTHLHAVPESGDGIVILTNSQRAWPLIAHLLTDWAQWHGSTTVGMSRIITATLALWTLIGALGAAALVQSARLVRDLTTARRHLAPLSPLARPGRLAAGFGAVSLVAVLAWAAVQDYLFITSVFPVASRCLATALGVTSLALALTALSPPTRQPDRPERSSQRAGGSVVDHGPADR